MTNKIITEEEMKDWASWAGIGWGYYPESEVNTDAEPPSEDTPTPKEVECICKAVQLHSGIWNKDCKYHKENEND